MRLDLVVETVHFNLFNTDGCLPDRRTMLLHAQYKEGILPVAAGEAWLM